VSEAFPVTIAALQTLAAILKKYLRDNNSLDNNSLYGRSGWGVSLYGLALIAVSLIAPAQAATTPTAGHTILLLGDSLSAAYGIPRESGWVALLEQKIAQQQLTNGNVARANVVNASISGETTDGGLARLPALLQKHKPDIVVIELGANDGLRGFQIDRLRDNLEKLIQLSHASNAKVLLVGIKIPPNYGLRYTSDFYESFTLLAHEYNVPLVPFLLEGVATDPELMQDDRLHPRAEAQKKILNTVWPHLQKML
jgi:acyl-CoA thioesterase-1